MIHVQRMELFDVGLEGLIAGKFLNILNPIGLFRIENTWSGRTIGVFGWFERFGTLGLQASSGCNRPWDSSSNRPKVPTDHIRSNRHKISNGPKMVPAHLSLQPTKYG